MTTTEIEIEQQLCRRIRPRLPVWMLTSEIVLATLADSFTLTAQHDPAADEISAGLDYSFTPQTKSLHLLSSESGGVPAVTSLALQADGKIVVAGPSIIRLNPDGSRDIAFQARLHIGAVIGQVLVQSDGRILVSSRFGEGLIDFEQPTRIARLNADGSRDMSFHPDQSFAAIYAMTVDATGRILVVGNSWVRSGVMRLNSDGSRDPSFVMSPDLSIELDDRAPSSSATIALQPDGRVLIAARSDFGANRVTRLNPDGSLDLTFGSGPGWVPWGATVVALQLDGRVLLGAWTLRRLNSDGTLDPDFDPGSGFADEVFDGEVKSIAVQADGRILVAGNFTMAAGQPRSGLARFSPNGSLDPDLRPRIANGSGASEVLAVQLQPDGRILIGGRFDSVNGARRYGIARLEPTPQQGINLGFGELTFRVSEDVGEALIAVQRFGDPTVPVSVQYATSSGTAVSGRDYTEKNGTLTFGSRETTKTFTVPITDNSSRNDNKTIHLHLNQPTGGVALTPQLDLGMIAIYDNEQAGSVDLGFDASITGDLPRAGVAVQADGKLLTSHGFNLTRLNRDGTQDESFKPNTGGRAVTSMLLDPDGKIVVGHSSILFSETATNVIIRRLNADGSSDQSFTPFVVSAPMSGPRVAGADGDVWAIQPDGKILLVMSIRTPPSSLSPFVSTLRRLNADGSLDSEFKTYELNIQGLSQVAVSDEGKIILAGSFDTDGSLIRLNSDGTVDTTFKPHVVASWVFSFAFQHGGKLVLIGEYENGVSGGQGIIVRLNRDGSRDASFRSDARVSGGARFALAPDGRILVLLGGDSVLTAGTVRRTGVARLNADGSLDEDFDVGPDFGADSWLTDSADAIVVQPDGQIVVAGHFIFGIVRLNGGANYLRLTPIVRLPPGPTRVGVIGRPGRTYTLEGSMDLRNWTLVGTQTAAGFEVEFEDADAVTVPQRIYRARLAQP